MTGPALVAFVVVLVGLLVLMGGLLLWQEGRSGRRAGEVAYVVDEAVELIHHRLEPGVRERVGKAGVRRIIEWEIFYLQGLAQPDRRRPVETVAGGWEGSAAYIVDRIAEVHGVAYDRADVDAVLRLEAGYLLEIGAVGGPVDVDDESDERGS